MLRFHPLALAGLLVFAGAPSAGAADTRAPANVIAIQVVGTVTVAQGKGTPPGPLASNATLAAGDIVETAPQSSVILVLPNGSTVTLKEKSRLAITLILQSPFAAPDLVIYDPTKPEPATSSTSLELMFGELVAKVRKLLPGSDFSIKTPAGQSGVKGTEFELAYAEDTAGEATYRLSTASGLVEFAPVDGPPVQAAANRQVEVRGRRGKTGLKLSPVQARPLPVEVRARIQKQNQAAAPEAVRALQQRKAARDNPTAKPGEPANPANQPTRPASRSSQLNPPRSVPPARRPPPPRKRSNPSPPPSAAARAGGKIAGSMIPALPCFRWSVLASTRCLASKRPKAPWVRSLHHFAQPDRSKLQTPA